MLGAVAPRTGIVASLILLVGTTSCELLFGVDGLSSACDGGCQDALDATRLSAREGSSPEAAGGDAVVAEEAAGSDGSVFDAPAGDEQVADAAAHDTGNEGGVEEASSPCACVDEPPAGWQGPVASWAGSGPPAACSGAYDALVLDAFANPIGAPAQCSCACGPLVGASCQASVSATLYSDHACTTPCASVTLTPGICTNVQGTCVNVFGISGVPLPAGGACAPQPITQVPAWSWAQAARACEPAQPLARASCSVGQVCAPAPSPPMAPRPCILASGDLACPAGAYSVRHVYYAALTDGRTCTACTCSVAAAATCTATAQQGCGQTGPAIPLPTPCASLPSPGSVTLTSAPTPGGGSCTPSGGQPTGTLVPAGATTLCCMP